MVLFNRTSGIYCPLGYCQEIGLDESKMNAFSQRMKKIHRFVYESLSYWWTRCWWIERYIIWLSAPFRTAFWKWDHRNGLNFKQAPNANSTIWWGGKTTELFFLINWYLYNIRTMRCVISNQSKQRSEMKKNKTSDRRKEE